MKSLETNINLRCVQRLSSQLTENTACYG